MTRLFLDDDELAELTGRKIRRCQIATLRTMGLPFRVNAAGRPVVCRSAVEGVKMPPTSDATEWQPAVLKHG